MATNAQGPAPLWATSNNNPDILNNAYVPLNNNNQTVNDKRLVTPEIMLPSTSGQLRFRSAYSLNYGGGSGALLEVSSPNVNGGAFTDVTDSLVGGSFVSGGYNGTATGANNPLLGQPTWIFYSNDPVYNPSTGMETYPYVDTIVNLGPTVAGQPIKLRFRTGSDGSGYGFWRVDNVVVRPQRCAPQLVSAVSRKVHGSAGPFDINLPLTGTPGVECRVGPVAGEHQIVLTFANSVAFTAASITAGTGNVTTSVSNAQVTVNLTGVTNAQTITLTLAGADDGVNFGDVSVSMGVLPGDLNGNETVTSTDISQAKIQSGHSITAANFRADVTANGSIDSSDVSFIKLRTGTGLP